MKDLLDEIREFVINRDMSDTPEDTQVLHKLLRIGDCTQKIANLINDHTISNPSVLHVILEQLKKIDYTLHNIYEDYEN